MCDHHPTDISRRGFAGLAALGVGLSLLPQQASAKDDPPGDTLCLMCIDHRYAADAVKFFDDHAGVRNYDLVALAGASLAGLPTTNFRNTYLGLWEQVTFAQKPPATEVQLRHPSIENIIVLDHMNCGAYHAEFPGDRDRTKEEAKHYAIARQVGPMFANRGLTTSVWLLDDISRDSKLIWSSVK